MVETDCNTSAAAGWLRRWLTPAAGSPAAENQARGMSPWIDLIHLLWSLWIVVVPWLNHRFDRAWWLSTLLSYPLFLGLFLATMLRPLSSNNRRSWACLGLSLLVSPWNPGAAGTYFLFACMTLDLEGGRWRGVWAFIGQLWLMVGLFIAVTHGQGYDLSLLLWLAGFALIGGAITQVMRAMQHRAERLRLSEAEVRRLAALAERERIGRDLHDLLGHTLSTITLKLELSRRLAAADPARSASERDQAEGIARQALAEVRAAVTGIRATDLAAELAAARLLLAPAGVSLQHDPLPTGLAPPLERSLALLIREAVTNIARHARARHASIHFQQEPQGLRVEIRDDGRGFRGGEGHGLAGMRERVAAHAGRIELHTEAGQGTRLVTHWPQPA